MINTACPDHADSGVLRTIDEAIIVARDLLRWCKNNCATEFMAETLVIFSTLHERERCCPAAMYANYLANAAYRIVLAGESA